jgi:MFS family permease
MNEESEERPAATGAPHEAAPDVSQGHDPYAALRYPNFRRLMSGTFLITIALMMQRVAIGYELYLLTSDPLALGLLGLAEAVPYMGLALFGGHLADRRSKVGLMQFAALTFVLGATLLLVAMLPSMRATLGTTVLQGVIYATVFIEGVARGFYHPASASLRPFLVERRHYGSGATWGSVAWQAGAIIGPAIGGFVYGAVGLSMTLVAVIVLLLCNLVLVGRIRPPATANQKESEADFFDSLREGFAYVRRTKIILYSISLDMVSVFFGGVLAILPIFAKDILHSGPEGLGILRAAPAVGATVTMLACAWFPPTHHAWRNLLACILGFGVATLAFGLSQLFWLSVVMLAATGAFDSVSVIIRSTILQTMTQDRMRGRVASVNSVFVSASNELGAFESGLAARLIGTVPSVVFGAAATLATAGWVWRRSAELFKVRLR